MGKKKNDKTSHFKINDVSMATFFKNNGSKMISMKNGEFVFEYDDTIEKNIKLYEDMLKKCMF